MRHKTLNSNARRLRKEMTEAERHLWRALRLRQVEGAKFRRQYIAGAYIVDFACLERRIVVEADGGQHSQNDNDKLRDAYLHKRGWRVLRFWNDDFLLRTGEVMAVIWEAVSDERSIPLGSSPHASKAETPEEAP